MNKLKIALSVVTLAALAACGGGGSDTPATSSNNTTGNSPAAVDTVTAASQATASQLSLAAISTGNADETAFDVAATIGDTWRIVLNTKTNTFTVKVLNTQYGLTDRSGSYTAATDGSVTTYTGTDFKLVVDGRTKSVSGNIKVGSRASAVSGTGYAVGDLAKLAGTYLYMGVTRNLDGSSHSVQRGSMKVAADGVVAVCDGGVFNAAGACVALAGFATPTTATLQLSKGTNGVVVAKRGTADFGTVHVHAGDRGPVLLFDRFGPNESNVMRVGTLTATKQVALTSADVDGTYTCLTREGESDRVVVSGTSARITELPAGSTHTEIVDLNKVSNGSALVDLNGVVSFRVAGEPLSEAAAFLPLSSSMAIALGDEPYPLVCRR